MKRIVDGVAYNTDTATRVARSESGDTVDIGGHVQNVLYVTRGGAFFLHWVQTNAYRDRHGELAERITSGVEPMTREEAQTWALTDVELLDTNAFGEPPEAESESAPGATLYARVPASLKAKVEQAAKHKGLSLNSWTLRCVERCADMDEIGRYLGEILSTGLHVKAYEAECFSKLTYVEMIDHMSNKAEEAARTLGWTGKELENLSNDAPSTYGSKIWQPYEDKE